MGFNYGTEVCQRLGAGAFGVVYKMDNPRGAPFSRKNPIVAVKKIAVSVHEHDSIFICKLTNNCHDKNSDNTYIIFSYLFYPLQNPIAESQDEVDILRKYHHSGIVKYLTSFTDIRGPLCIVMEYCDYGSLSKTVMVSNHAELVSCKCFCLNYDYSFSE